MTPRVDRRQRRTREAIVGAAVELFGERGYGGVGIDEIGASAGVSGPAVYQYFASKRELLAAVLEPGVRHTRRLAEAAVREAATPHAALDALVRSYVAVALDASDRFELYRREQHNLSEVAHARLRDETRLFLDAWVSALAPLRPELGPAELRLAVRGVVGMVSAGVASREGLAPAELEPLLIRMCLDALAPPDSPDTRTRPDA